MLPAVCRQTGAALAPWVKCAPRTSGSNHPIVLPSRFVNLHISKCIPYFFGASNFFSLRWGRSVSRFFSGFLHCNDGTITWLLEYTGLTLIIGWLALSMASSLLFYIPCCNCTIACSIVFLLVTTKGTCQYLRNLILFVWHLKCRWRSGIL